jgi:hypothetical protein
MTIIATIPHLGEYLIVEVIDTYYSKALRRRMATVKALHDEPFSAWTHGGFAYYNITNVPIDCLVDLNINQSTSKNPSR